MGFLADYSFARPGGAAIAAAGCSGVIRYTGAWRNDGAIITAAEYADLTAHGLAVGLVMEYAADWILSGYAKGLQLAQAARALERSMGIPDGVTYLAADFDIQPYQYGQALDTMHGCADGYGGWQYVRPYGSKAFCEWVGSQVQITGAWSTQAWSWIPGVGFMPAKNAAIYQYASWPAGVPFLYGCDYNAVFGNWAPRTSPVPVHPDDPTGDPIMALPLIDVNGPLRMDHPNVRTLQGLLEARGAWVRPDNTDHKVLLSALKFFQQQAKLAVDLKVGPKTWAALCNPLNGK